MRTIRIFIPVIFLVACNAGEQASLNVDYTRTFTLINPDGTDEGKVEFNASGSYLLIRTQSIIHPDDQSIVNLMVKTIGMYESSSNGVLILGDQIHSGFFLYDRWGKEKDRYTNLSNDVAQFFPIPSCRTVLLSDNNLLIQ